MDFQKIAEEVADALMTGYDGVGVDRLALKRGPTESERNLGGLCRGTVVDRVREVLNSRFPPNPQPRRPNNVRTK
jgi:hypothetical protein